MQKLDTFTRAKDGRMAKKMFVVRIVQTDGQNGGEISGAFLECLRYAGIVGFPPGGGELAEKCFDLLCPDPTYNTQTWAEQNAARMRTFGFAALAVPWT